jgi:hypothetical protein
VTVELDPLRKNAAYKWFVENLCNRGQSCVSANRIRKNGHPERMNDADLPLEADEVERKRIFLGLAPEEREALARMLEHERMAAYHDVAAFLEGQLGDGLKVSFQGEPISASPYWSMHYDLVAVAAGDGWEDEQ